jgi:PAS domain S-box-containing protein
MDVNSEDSINNRQSIQQSGAPDSLRGTKKVSRRLPDSDGAILDAYPDPCLLLDARGNLIAGNLRARSILGDGKNAFRHREFLAYFGDDGRSRCSMAFARILSGSTEESFDAGIQTRPGTRVDVRVLLSPCVLTSVDGTSAALVVLRDLETEKKKDLDLLRFSNVAHFTVNPLEITDVEGKIVYVNPAFEKASGYAREELLGRTPAVFGSGKHPKAFWKSMWDTIKAGRVWTGEVENRRRDGEIFYSYLLVSPIVDGRGVNVGYFGIHRDISDQKHLERQLIHAQKLESIGLLAAGVAHEVGNPLTSISSLVQVIQRETKEVFTQEKLELIKSQINRISRIIRDLVDFSRRSSHEVHLTDVNKSIREAIAIVQVGKKAKELEFTVALDPSIPPLPVVADQLEQVFINVLINAVDAIHERKSQDCRGHITVTTMLNSGEARITIWDNGRGISRETMPKIFQPFFTTKKVGAGTGLGLWVSYGIIKSFQGDIVAESIDGRGTTFTITLPLTRATTQ